MEAAYEELSRISFDSASTCTENGLEKFSRVSIDSAETCIETDPEEKHEFMHNRDTNESNALTSMVLAWIFAAWILSYHQMASASLLPVYLLDDTEPLPSRFNQAGSLGRTLPQAGTILTANSLMSLVAQGVIYPVVVSRYGIWNCLLSVLILAPIPYHAIHSISANARHWSLHTTWFTKSDHHHLISFGIDVAQASMSFIDRTW